MLSGEAMLANDERYGNPISVAMHALPRPAYFLSRMCKLLTYADIYVISCLHDHFEGNYLG